MLAPGPERFRKTRNGYVPMPVNDSSIPGRLSRHFQMLKMSLVRPGHLLANVSATNLFIREVGPDRLAGEPMRVRSFAETGKRITRRVRARERM